MHRPAPARAGRAAHAPAQPGRRPTNELSHLVAIAVDGTGEPLRLFATNRWVHGARPGMRPPTSPPCWTASSSTSPHPSWPLNRWLTADFFGCFGRRWPSFSMPRDPCGHVLAPPASRQGAWSSRIADSTWPRAVEYRCRRPASPDRPGAEAGGPDFCAKTRGTGPDPTCLNRTLGPPLA